MRRSREKNTGKQFINQQYKQERLKIIFEYSPVAIWEEDFSALAELKKTMEKAKAKDIKKYLKEDPDLVKRTFRKFKVLDVNKAAIRLYGARSKKELIANLDKIFNKDVAGILVDEFTALLEGKSIFEAEFKSKTLDGETYDVLLRVSVPEMFKGSFERVIVTFLDISVQKKLERNLRRLAQIDGLTKLFNQVAIKQRLKEEFIRAKRYNQNLSCMMIDLDRFKNINDKFGHQKGDQILRRTASLVEEHLREVDIVGRYGGDEFLAILPETPKENAMVAALRIRDLFNNLSKKKKGALRFSTVSIGVSGYCGEELKSANDLIAKSDEAMYSAKKAGRNQVV